jgi:hypothetical protein
MSEPRPWTVNQPEALVQRDEALWTIDDQVPGLPGAGRRMSILKRADGGLIFYNAIPVPDATLDQIRALGKPAQLVLPNHFHALDSAAFAQKLAVTAYAPAIGVEKLARRVKCEPITSLPPEPSLKHFTVTGFATHEAVIVFGRTLLVADLVTNVPHRNTPIGLMMRLVGFTGAAPKLPKPVQKRVGRDFPAVRALLEELAAVPGLSRIIPSHGRIVETDAPAALKAVAQSLS